MAMGNNPVAFIDPDGEWAGWDDLIAGIVGGVINVAANWNNIDNIWEGIATFGVGAGLGVAGLYTAGSTWAKLGVVAGSGIVAGATNNMIAQLDHNTNFSQLNWGEVGIGGGVGMLSSLAGYGAGQWASDKIGGGVINSFRIDGGIIGGGVKGILGGGIGGYAGGFTGGLLYTGNVSQAHQYGMGGLKTEAAIGGGAGAGNGFLSARRSGVNIWTGRSKGLSLSAHAQQRMSERNVNTLDMNDALKNPLKVTDIKFRNGKPSQKLIGRKVTIIINPETKKIITTYPTKSRTVNKLLNK